MEFEDRSFTIGFELGPTPILNGDDGRSDALVEIRGALTTKLDDDPEPRLIGNLRARILLAGNVMNEGHDVHDECDAIAADLAVLASFLYDVEGEFTSKVKAAIGTPTSGRDTLLIDHVILEPEFRGFGFGLGAVVRCIQYFGRGCGLAVLRPYPLQFTRRGRDDAAWRASLGTERFVGDYLDAARRLERYWGKLGFRPLGETGYCLLNLDDDLPTRATLGLEE